MTGNPYTDRKARQGIGISGRKSEKKTARRLNMNQTPASGAAIGKGDLRDKEWLVECKSTTSDSLSLKIDYLSKITMEANMTGRTPAIAITFTDLQGKPWPVGSWVMISEHTFIEMQSIAREEGA